MWRKYVGHRNALKCDTDSQIFYLPLITKNVGQYLIRIKSALISHRYVTIKIRVQCVYKLFFPRGLCLRSITK